MTSYRRSRDRNQEAGIGVKGVNVEKNVPENHDIPDCLKLQLLRMSMMRFQLIASTTFFRICKTWCIDISLEMDSIYDQANV